VTTLDREQKHVTGHVGNGNMRIDEFAQPVDDSLPFDPIEDLVVYMRNDPALYRKSVYPALSKMSDCARNKQEFDFNETMKPIVINAAKSYCKKYNMPKPAGEIFPLESVASVIERLKEIELEQIQKGTY